MIMITSKKKAIILLVSIALINVAFSAIINFHFYRIFGKELAKVESKFIKKDDNFICVKSFVKHFDGKIIILSNANLENFDLSANIKLCGVKLEKTLLCSSVFELNINDISPTRGSPILS